MPFKHRGKTKGTGGESGPRCQVDLKQIEIPRVNHWMDVWQFRSDAPSNTNCSMFQNSEFV